MAAPTDTSAAAWARQIAALRAMGPEARVRLAAAMSDEVRQVSREGAVARAKRFDPGATSAR